MQEIFNQIQIQTVTGCNLKCPMCPNSYMTQPKKTMSRKVFEKIINELVDIDYKGRVSLYLMNEPFLDSRLKDLVAYTREQLPNNRINISTNGVLVDNIDLPGITDVDVSCYTQEIYDKWADKEVNRVNMIDYKYDYNNRGGNIDGGKANTRQCERPSIQMYINAFGKAVLCCSDYKFEVVMGDVNKTSLVNIWNNKKYQSYRSSKQRSLPLCKECSY